MAFVSVTRLRIRSARHLLPFAWHTWRSVRQLERADGFLEGRLATGAGRVFWTLTLWRDAEAMLAYRNADAHMRAMPKLIRWCDEASVVHWEQETPELPGNEEARDRMVAGGRLSKVRRPSEAHAARSIPEGLPRPGGTRVRPAAPKAVVRA